MINIDVTFTLQHSKLPLKFSIKKHPLTSPDPSPIISVGLKGAQTLSTRAPAGCHFGIHEYDGESAAILSVWMANWIANNIASSTAA